ncbi:hypothetical protein [Geodermatophilus sp. DSM 44513]|uniref:hypothetical protein n=1 Tax=Geodermatophilus sp. DSM 44513 TaxID=1528104 RepID=UPI001276CD7C|nr:hypothetical protein [Geodermatophilus sp. DSM 44513]WNV76433.1 hypothetical protein RTG05_03985 [Geodermatophilus sp. DSM 44513]
MTGLVLLAAEQQQLPEDVGKSGPIGALLTVLIFIAILLLVRSMTTHLKRVPRSFDTEDDGPQVVVPDTPAELIDGPPAPGQDLLDTLRRAPRAIEGPRRDDGEPDATRD